MEILDCRRGHVQGKEVDLPNLLFISVIVISNISNFNTTVN